MPKQRYLKYGWNPDIPDKRDLKKICRLIPTAEEIDLSISSHMPPVFDQGELGSCVANATGAAFAYDHLKEHGEIYIPSRLFIYYNAREIENSINSDDGCQIRDAVKQLAALGTCHEDMWEYNISKFATKPTKKCYSEALKNQVLRYQRVNQTQQDIESVLFSGYPVVFGMAVYEGLESEEIKKTGILPMPDLENEKSLGGHAVMIVGYNRPKRKFKIRNSWSADWGIKGHFWADYDYILDSDLCDDFWVLQSVE